MVQTKASELSDIPGVNTPLNESSESIIKLPIHKDSQKLHSWINRPFERINYMNDSVIK